MAIIFYSEHVETKEITMKLLKIKGILSGTQLTVKQYNFASKCNIDNFDGIENGRDRPGSFYIFLLLLSTLFFLIDQVLKETVRKDSDLDS